jgi:hypothetical protein
MHYNDSAEIKKLEGWCCKKCNRFYYEREDLARYCCATIMVCGKCGKDNNNKTYTICEECRKKNEEESWLKKEGEWDGESMLYSDSSDRYFNNLDEVYDYSEEESIPIDEMKILLCKQEKISLFSIEDYLCDYLPEDYDLDCKEIDDVVNRWITENVPGSFYPSNKKLKC